MTAGRAGVGRVGGVTGRAASGFPTVGIVGAGQLARMSVAPAVELGVRLRVLAERADDPAAQVVPDVTVGDYRDLADAAGVRAPAATS